jgi:hypothetical protein
MTTLTPTGAGTAAPAAMTGHVTREPVCALIPGIDGDLQVVHSRSGQTVLDVQSIHFDVAGGVRHDHATMRLTYDAVCELRALLGQITAPTERHEPALWSEITFTQPIPGRRRKQRSAVA